VIDGQTWATIVDTYGFIPNSKNGWDAALGIVNECVDLLDSGNGRVKLAGDFNLWPEHIVPIEVGESWARRPNGTRSRFTRTQRICWWFTNLDT
jgi:hypothetical protein